jgi:hypothetical protein
MPPQSKHCSVLFFEGVPQLPDITPHTGKSMHFWMEKGVNFFFCKQRKTTKNSHDGKGGAVFLFKSFNFLFTSFFLLAARQTPHSIAHRTRNS